MTLALCETRLVVDRVCAWDQLTQLADDWNRLADDVPFRRSEWMHTWWIYYAQPRAELFTLAVYDIHGALVGLAPWYLDRHWLNGRVVRFLGAGEVCSEYPTIMAAPEHRDAVVRAVANWLTRQPRGTWDLLEFDGVEQSDPSMTAFAQQMRQQGHESHVRARYNSWRVDLPEQWDAYLATLSKGRRERTRSVLRKTIGSGRAAQLRVTEPSELPWAFAVLETLHQRRRASLGQPGCFASRRFKDFHAAVAERFLAIERLRLLRIELAGRPIAAEYDFTGGDTVYYYQTGLEPDAESERPGWIQVAGSIRDAIEQGYRTFDFLRGDEPYKASWGATSHPLLELRVAARHCKSRLRFLSWRAGLQARLIWQQWQERWRPQRASAPQPAEA